MRLAALFALSLLVAACGSDDTAPAEGASTDVAADAAVATPTSRVTVDYRGTLPDGTVFDQGERVSFSLQQVVDGFRENIAGMRVGETKTFDVPPEKGYGDFPPPGIPRDTDLTFEVTLHGVE